MAFGLHLKPHTKQLRLAHKAAALTSHSARLDLVRVTTQAKLNFALWWMAFALVMHLSDKHYTNNRPNTENGRRKVYRRRSKGSLAQGQRFTGFSLE
jgi:hypothetical protein